MRRLIWLSFVVCLSVPISGASWTAWLDGDDPSDSGGDFETLPHFEPNPCPSGTPLIVQGRIKGTSYIVVSASQRIDFGPQYGLVCENSLQPNEETCGDYKVQYVDPATSVMFDRDNPVGTGDWELKHLITGNAWKAGKRIRWFLNVNNYGESVYKLTVGPNVGLFCANFDNDSQDICPDYEVRFYCP